MKKKVLCIEDDKTTQTLVEVALHDYEVISVPTLLEADRIIRSQIFSAILIDIQLPDGDGLRFLTQIMSDARFKSTPALILSGHSEISNKVMAFSFGAEDFIGKPFDPIELHARVSAKIKKHATENESLRHRALADILIDFDRQKAFHIMSGKETDLNLTGIELKILSLLTKRLEQVYSRSQIMDQVWGQTAISDRTIDSHVAHLRQKIEGCALVIETSKSFGYSASIKKK